MSSPTTQTCKEMYVIVCRFMINIVYAAIKASRGGRGKRSEAAGQTGERWCGGDVEGRCWEVGRMCQQGHRKRPHPSPGENKIGKSDVGRNEYWKGVLRGERR